MQGGRYCVYLLSVIKQNELASKVQVEKSWLIWLFINLFLLLLATLVAGYIAYQIVDLHGLWPPVRSQTSWRARLMMPWLALRAKPKCSINTGYRTSQCRLVVKLWGSRSYMLYHMEVVLRVLCVTMSLAALCCLFLCVCFGGGTQSHHQIYQYLAVVSGAIRFFPRAVSETPGQWPISFASTFIWQCEEETSTRWQQLTTQLNKLSTLRPLPTPVEDSIFGIQRDPQL